MIRRRPLVFYTICFMAGIISSDIIKRTILYMALLFLLFLITQLYKSKKEIRIYLICVLCIFVGEVYGRQFLLNRLSQVEVYNQRGANIVTVIASKGVQKNKYIEYIGREVVVNANKIGSDILLRSKEDYEVGDKITADVIITLPQKARNFGGFNYCKYLSTKNIFSICEVIKNEKTISHGNINVLEKFSLYIKNIIITSINRTLPSPESEVLKAIMIGEDSLIDEETGGWYRNAGMLHLLVVSGGNIAFVIAIFLYVIRKIRISRIFQNYILIFIVMVYILITGAEMSILRAGMVAIVILTADLIGRQNDSFTTIALVGGLMLIINPMAIYSLGFLLSFSGVAGIIALTKPIENKLIFIPKGIRELMSVTIAAQIAVLPIILYCFNTVNISGLFSNILAIPLMGIIMPLGFISCIPIAGKFVAGGNYILIKAMTAIAKFFSDISVLNFTLPTPSIVSIVGYYILVFAIFSEIKIKVKTIISGILIIVICIFWVPIFNKDFEIDVIDVGHGDSILITTPNRRAILIDTGGSYKVDEREYNAGKQTVVPFILDKGYKRIDLLIATHLDEDHIGGLNEIIEEIKVSAVAIGENSKKSEGYNEINEMLCKKGVKLINFSSGNKFTIDGVNFEVLNPDKQVTGSENNNSVVVMAEYDGIKTLFVGDLEKEGEELLIKKYGKVIDADILKIGHHGSGTSTSQEFLNEVSPQISLISVGTRFSSLPNKQVLERLSNTEILRTDKIGGLNIKIKKWKKAKKYDKIPMVIVNGRYYLLGNREQLR